METVTGLRQWLTLGISHHYFEDGKCPVLKLAPITESRRIMKNYGIHFRELNSRYIGYVGGNSSSDFEEVLPKNQDLYFQLVNTDPYFDNYTEVVLPRKDGTRLYLTNSITEEGETIPTNLYLSVQGLRFSVAVPSQAPTSISIKNSQREEIFKQTSIQDQSTVFVDINVFGTGVYELWVAGSLSKTFFGTSEDLVENCYGLVHVQMPSILTELKKNEASMLQIDFQARETYWQYHVIIPQDKKITVQAVSVEGVDGLPFSDLGKKMIGGQESHMFMSPDPIRLSQKAEKTPILKMQYTNDFSDTVLEMELKMPLPDIATVATKDEFNGNVFCSQAIIYV